MSRNLTKIHLADAGLSPGDILVWCAYRDDDNKDAVSPLANEIARIGLGWSYHISVVGRALYAIEMLPGGGQRNPIAHEVAENPGQIHHFRVPDTVSLLWGREVETHGYAREKAVDAAEKFIGTPYGYDQILHDLLQHSTWARWLVEMPTDDSEVAKQHLVCSGLGAIAVNAGLGFDLFPNLSDAAVQPSDFCRCPILRDCGRLIP